MNFIRSATTPPSVPVAGRLRNSGMIVGAGLALELGSQFARTVILARMLGATEFGMAASINALVTLVEMSSFIGLDRYLVYSRDGGSEAALGAVHGLALIRGALTAAVVVALAWPTAALMGEPQNTISMAMVALVPLMRSFIHLGAYQVQRYGHFWPSTLAEGGGAVLGLVAAAVAAMIQPTHVALVWSLGVQCGAAVLITHLLSGRNAFRISFNRSELREALDFGWPLTVNGLGLAVTSQLDRLVVGAWLGVIAVGIYGIAVTLLLQPVALILRMATTVLQPRLSAAWHADPAISFPRKARRLAHFSGALGLAGAATAICVGSPLMLLIFGPNYVMSDLAFVLLGAVVLLRLGRGCHNLLGLAIGSTADLMVSNLAGGIGLAATLVLLYLHPAVESAFGGILLGDLISFTVVVARLDTQIGAAGRSMVRAMGAAAMLPALLSIWVLLAHPPLAARVAGALIGVAIAAAPARKLLAEL